MSRVTLVLKTNEGGAWILSQIATLASRGATVTVVLPPGRGRLRRALDEVGCPVVESPFDFNFRPSARLLSGLWHLHLTLRATAPDTVFYHLYASALACRFASWGLGARRVHMVAGPLYLENPTIRMAERLLRRMDDHLIAGSEYTARAYRRLGVSSENLSSIPYGVDVSRFARGEDQRDELFGVPAGTFVAVMVAYVYAPKSSVFPGVGIKGHDVLLAAWAHFVGLHPDSLLVLVGSGFDPDGEDHRQRLIASYNLDATSTVRWLDSVDDVRPLYSSADVSVSPSLSENHGAALEASSMGLPSIVSDAGGLPEAVTLESGWVVPAGDADALRSALVDARGQFDRHELRRMGTEARSLMESTFSLEQSNERITDIVVGPKKSPRPAVIAFSEQRSWLRDGEVQGRKALPIVAAIAEATTVVLAIRVGEEEAGGVPLARGATARPLPGAVSSSPILFLGDLGSMMGKVVREVLPARVVYADQPGIVGGLGLIIGYALRKPLVVNVVGDSAESVHPSVIPGIKGRIAHAILPRVQSWACAQAVLVNYVTSRVLQEAYPATRALEVFASSSVSALGPARPRLFRPGSVSLVTIASLERPYKGIKDLIDAIAECNARGRQVSLTVIGDGRMRTELENHADVAAPGCVSFRGHLYGSEVYEELGQHDAFALASWTEGLPRALVEAMADGLPAVATAVGGVPELLEARRTCPPRDSTALADRIIALVSDPHAWTASIHHNLQVSAAILEARTNIHKRFVKSIVELADRGT